MASLGTPRPREDDDDAWTLRSSRPDRAVSAPVAAHPVPKVGDTVVLNDDGLEQVFGRKLGLAHMKTLEMKITHVDRKSMTAPEETFVVEVDDPEINQYLIDHRCFDIVKRK